MPKAPIASIELPSQDVAASKHLYGSVFGWTFHDFGPNYAAFSDAGVEGGFNGHEERTKAPLVVPETDDLEAMCASVAAAGGIITAPIFSLRSPEAAGFTSPIPPAMNLLSCNRHN